LSASWYGNCTACNRRALQRVVRSAQRITGGKLPALQDTYSTRCHRKAKKIKDINHPGHGLFTLFPSRRQGQYRCIKAGTKRLKNSFYLKAIRLIVITSQLPPGYSILHLRACCPIYINSLVTLVNGTLATSLMCTYCFTHFIFIVASKIVNP
jgi:hypothetical protein